MITIKPISRYRAASIHLTLSAVIAAIALAGMLFVWYPPPLFQALGGTELVLLIIGIDVIIGPLLTLIVFDTRKKELIFDLAIIACVQLAALSYGVYAMHTARPVYIAFVENRFSVVAAGDLEDESLAQAKPEYRSLSITGPILVAVDMPTDKETLDTLRIAAAFSGLGAQNLPKYYAPYASQKKQILEASLPLDKLLGNDSPETQRTQIKAFLEKHGKTSAETRALPVLTRRQTLIAVIDGNSAALLGLLPFDMETPP